MPTKRKILFIINPNAGKKNVKLNDQAIRKIFPSGEFEIEVKQTEAEDHANAISSEYKDKVDTIVAVGGDGTINEIGKALINTDVVLGIVPAGSGNGLARSLKIPLSAEKALTVIKKNALKQIDAIAFNDTYFFNVAGVGFDAYVARLFNKGDNRGLGGYIQIVLKKFFTYKGKKFEISINGDRYNEQAFLVSFANSAQYGNNAYIAPKAKLDDGLFELCVLKDFPRWQTPGLAIKLFNKQIDRSPFYITKSVKELKLKASGEIWAHLDGEPRVFQDEIKMSLLPKALKVIANDEN